MDNFAPPPKLQAITGGKSTSWKPPTLTEWMEQEVEHKKWLVEGFVPSDALILLSGHQKRAMKTLSALAMSLACASGRQVSLFKPQRKMKVLFIEEEGAHIGTKDRIRALMNTYGIKKEHTDNIFFAFRNRVKLNKRAWRQNLCRLIEQEGIDLVFLDAIVYLHEGDENKVNEMAPVIDTMQGMRAAGASVVYIAHLNGTRGEDKKADMDTQVRGAGVIVNCYDMHLAYRRYKMSDLHIDLSVRAREDAERLYSIAWQFEKGKDGVLKTAALSMVERVQDDVDLDGMSRRVVGKFGVGQVVTKHKMRKESGVSIGNFGKILDWCLEKGWVSKDGSKFVIEGVE